MNAVYTGMKAYHSRFSGTLLRLEEDCFGFAAARAELVGTRKLGKEWVSHGNFKTTWNVSMTRARRAGPHDDEKPS